MTTTDTGRKGRSSQVKGLGVEQSLQGWSRGGVRDLIESLGGLGGGGLNKNTKKYEAGRDRIRLILQRVHWLLPGSRLKGGSEGLEADVQLR